jgi:hypothetical protein
LPRKRSGGLGEPGIGALGENASTMRAVDLVVAQQLAGLLSTKTAIGTPQARWRESTQSGRVLDHRAQAVLAGAADEAVASIAASARARRSSRRPIGLSM